jgi:uncharacterized protein Yka (UPF0111/DUF47 family)
MAGARVSARRWFLPETPDVLGRLREQLAITIEGVDAFASWANGNAAALALLDDAEHRSTAAARALLEELRTAFVTPLEPEDLFTLSRGIGRILDFARDAVDEAEVMASLPDEGVVDMATHIGVAVRHLDAAIAGLGGRGADATIEADAAIAAVARLDAAYVQGMAALLDVEERSSRIGGRETYRRCKRIGEVINDVAERVIYALVKQS